MAGNRCQGRKINLQEIFGADQDSFKELRREVLLEMNSRGLRGVEFVASDDHPGLKRAIAEVIPEAVWPRCRVNFLRNALDHLP